MIGFSRNAPADSDLQTPEPWFRVGGASVSAAYAYDLKAMAGWSSNPATNRVLRRLGGPATAAEGLRRFGAVSKTFPGEGVVGTELQPSLPGRAPQQLPPMASVISGYHQFTVLSQ